jgi:DNA repair protein RadA/Sms
MERVKTGTREFDRILQGGLMRGTLTCLTGYAGCGKTTLCLQTALDLSANLRVLYITGDSDPSNLQEQIKKLTKPGAHAPKNLMFTTPAQPIRQGPAVLGWIHTQLQAEVVIVDAVPSLKKEDLLPRPSRNAVEKTMIVLSADLRIPDDDIELADVVVHIDAVANDRTLRILKLRKNRFGSTDGAGRLLATSKGLRSNDAGTLAAHHGQRPKQ